ncbi:MAG: aldose 1-epimerase family protein [Spirochaetia bacterium]|nr:aldose 1-epimerase family protein [Spirochaetia bacterium]
MKVQLKNDFLQIVIDTKGAELHSVKRIKDGKEYLWCGNPEVWRFHAPILFPITGRLKEGYMIWEEKKYTMPNHGFARDLEHSLVESSETRAVFRLTENEETLKAYPWSFVFETEYVLEGEKVSFKTTVKNSDSRDILFGLGSHTALLCPQNTEKESAENYVLEFEKEEDIQQIIPAEDAFLKSAQKDKQILVTEKYPHVNHREIALKDNFFGDGHILTGLTSSWIALVHKASGEKVKVNVKDYPYVVLWQNPGKCRFVCIEPWFGLPDFTNTKHLWEEKFGLNRLKPGESFTSDQSLTFSR